jgi:hypothetical protein
MTGLTPEQEAIAARLNAIEKRLNDAALPDIEDVGGILKGDCDCNAERTQHELRLLMIRDKLRGLEKHREDCIFISLAADHIAAQDARIAGLEKERDQWKAEHQHVFDDYQSLGNELASKPAYPSEEAIERAAMVLYKISELTKVEYIEWVYLAEVAKFIWRSRISCVITELGIDRPKKVDLGHITTVIYLNILNQQKDYASSQSSQPLLASGINERKIAKAALDAAGVEYE